MAVEAPPPPRIPRLRDMAAGRRPGRGAHQALRQSGDGQLRQGRGRGAGAHAVREAGDGGEAGEPDPGHLPRALPLPGPGSAGGGAVHPGAGPRGEGQLQDPGRHLQGQPALRRGLRPPGDAHRRRVVAGQRGPRAQAAAAGQPGLHPHRRGSFPRGRRRLPLRPAARQPLGCAGGPAHQAPAALLLRCPCPLHVPQPGHPVRGCHQQRGVAGDDLRRLCCCSLSPASVLHRLRPERVGLLGIKTTSCLAPLPRSSRFSYSLHSSSRRLFSAGVDTFVSEESMLEDPRRLYPPGRLFHVTYKEPCCCCCSFPRPSRMQTAIPVEGRFERLVVSRTVTSDHHINNYNKFAEQTIQEMTAAATGAPAVQIMSKMDSLDVISSLQKEDPNKEYATVYVKKGPQ